MTQPPATSLTAPAQALISSPRNAPALALSSAPALVLIHGAWHGASTYERVIARLAALGCFAVARDLPGHGLNARFPRAYQERPLDAAAFAAEPSPVAGITLDDYVDSTLATVEQMRALGHEQVVLVGHSMGGIVVSAVAERIPERCARLVYLAAFMPASEVAAATYIRAPENAGELVSPQFLADPALIGALRMDHRSSSPSYRRQARQAFYADVAEAEAEAMTHLLTPDVPLAPMLEPITLSAQRWGRVPRHYIRCLEDRALMPALQQRFIDQADAWLPDHPTVVHSLDASHSPFLSQPDALAELLASIAAA